MKRKTTQHKEPAQQKEATMRLHIKCPNCGQPLYGYKTRQLSSSLTEVSYECRSRACKGEFVANVEVVRTLHVPKVIMPGFNVSLSPIVAARGMAEALRYLPVAAAPQDMEIINEAMPQRDLFYSEAANDTGPS